MRAAREGRKTGPKGRKMHCRGREAPERVRFHMLTFGRRLWVSAHILALGRHRPRRGQDCRAPTKQLGRRGPAHRAQSQGRQPRVARSSGRLPGPDGRSSKTRMPCFGDLAGNVSVGPWGLSRGHQLASPPVSYLVPGSQFLVPRLVAAEGRAGNLVLLVSFVASSLVLDSSGFPAAD